MFSLKMGTNVSTVTKHNRQTKFATFAKNKAMADGHNVHANFVENGFIKIVTNTSKQETTCSQQTMKKFTIVHFADVYKRED